MTNSWANSGVDLHLDLSGAGRRASLEEALRRAITSGQLRAGDRLPASRQLSLDLGLARNTVADAYAQLGAEGWLTARQGSGTYVSTDALCFVSGVATGVREAAPAHDDAPALDLVPGTPDVAAFPRTAWVGALRRALGSSPSSAFAYGDPRGRPELRAALAHYLARTRGVRASPDQIVVCSGFAQGLRLLATVLRESGAAAIAVESHGHAAHRRTIAAVGLDTPHQRVDHDGLVIDGLRDEAAVLVTAAHQFPLGIATGPFRRARLVRWGRDTAAMLIEDDYDGEFRYDRSPVGALQGMAPDVVVYAGTVSKTLAPGVRLGWLVVPDRWLERVTSAKSTVGDGTSVLDQLALAEMITCGAYDRHVRGRRSAYRRRRDRLVDVLHEQAPDVSVTGLSAGLHALVTLPPWLSEDDAVQRARDAGLRLEGLDSFRSGGPPRSPALVIGYAAPPEHLYEQCLAALCRVLARPARTRAPQRSGDRR